MGFSKYCDNKKEIKTLHSKITKIVFLLTIEQSVFKNIYILMWGLRKIQERT